MNILSLILISIFNLSTWGVDITQAKNQAKSENKKILINFSGSDWCGPCIKLKRDFFEKEEFTVYSDKSLVLLRADFPRKKVNQLSKELTLQNEKLAELYNPEGKFPFTVLIDENGKIIKSWDGYPKTTVPGFIQQIHAASKGK